MRTVKHTIYNWRGVGHGKSPPSEQWRIMCLGYLFSHLLAQVYSLYADAMSFFVETLIIPSQINCRGDPYNISSQVAADIKHKQSWLLEFLRDCKFCLFSGRINPANVDATPIPRWKTVVDFTIMTLHDCLDSCIDSGDLLVWTFEKWPCLYWHESKDMQVRRSFQPKDNLKNPQIFSLFLICVIWVETYQ